MVQRLHSLGFSLIIISLVLFGYLFTQHGDGYILAILVFIIGLLLLLFTSNETNKERSLLCRIQLHKYQAVGQDSDINSKFIYECMRCRRRKSVFRAF
ncbi:hypothetical protein [Marinococcus halotolerans]|uniref:hypothetical protein n=1 Tax=Marinococcus halotolerans TaxID=301092 RepID=UPI0003B6C1AE|nr:hypothetical protein [Marinococcus halotolerans]